MGLSFDPSWQTHTVAGSAGLRSRDDADFFSILSGPGYTSSSGKAGHERRTRRTACRRGKSIQAYDARQKGFATWIAGLAAREDRPRPSVSALLSETQSRSPDRVLRQNTCRASKTRIPSALSNIASA